MKPFVEGEKVRMLQTGMLGTIVKTFRKRINMRFETWARVQWEGPHRAIGDVRDPYKRLERVENAPEKLRSKGYREIRPGYLMRDDGLVEAVRYYKSKDAINWSGWVVRETKCHGSYSDPIATKPEAIKQLLMWGLIKHEVMP